MKNIFLKIVFGGLFIISTFIPACDSNQNDYSDLRSDEKLVVNLKGQWKFSLGDDTDWKKINFNDNQWDKIAVPSPWENQGFPGYNGYAWYRKTFQLPSDASYTNYYLMLGYVDDVDQTYLNGKLIGISGGFPPHYQTAYNALRKYYVPTEFLNMNGDNVISVRVYDAELDGGIVSGNVGIYTVSDRFEPDINLSGIWNFKPGDESNWSKINSNDSGWFKIMVPAHWEIQGFNNYDGFAWYRKTFYLPENYSNEDMILFLGQIDDIDQTFVNGTLVGSTGKWNFQDKPTSFNDNGEWQEKRVYTIPKKLLNFGNYNTIAVRVYDGIGEGGIYNGPIGLVTQSKYKKYFTKNK